MHVDLNQDVRHVALSSAIAFIQLKYFRVRVRDDLRRRHARHQARALCIAPPSPPLPTPLHMRCDMTTEATLRLPRNRVRPHTYVQYILLRPLACRNIRPAPNDVLSSLLPEMSPETNNIDSLGAGLKILSPVAGNKLRNHLGDVTFARARAGEPRLVDQ